MTAADPRSRRLAQYLRKHGHPRATLFVMLVAISGLAVMGYLFECVSPNARSIGDVVRTVLR